MRFILVFMLLISLTGYGQPWKNYIISVRGDTLNRVDMKDKKQGPWVVHVEPLRGEPGYDEQGYFLEDKKDGAWVRFTLDGDKIAEENYRWGVLDGKARYYTRNGGLIREESWRAIDPEKTMDTVNVYDVNDPNKVIDQVIVKLTGQTNKHGTWTYYDAMWGTVVKTERYFLDKLQTGDQNGVMGGDDDLQPIDITKSKSDTAGKKPMTKPKEVLEYEKKNSGKKKIKVRDGSTGGY